MTRTEIKEKAQDEIMLAIQTAFGRISDNECGEYSDTEIEEIKAEASKQMARIEGTFGYEKNSWQRGC